MPITLDEARKIHRKGPLGEFFIHGNNMVTAMLIRSGQIHPPEETPPEAPRPEKTETPTQDN